MSLCWLTYYIMIEGKINQIKHVNASEKMVMFRSGRIKRIVLDFAIVVGLSFVYLNAVTGFALQMGD